MANDDKVRLWRKGEPSKGCAWFPTFEEAALILISILHLMLRCIC